jgi:hypothetical protein
MGRIGIVAFEPAHLAELEPPVFCRAQMRRFAAAYVPTGPAFTLMEEGRVLGCGGLVIEGDEGKAWMFLSDGLRARPMLLHRTVKRALPALVRSYRLRGVSAEAHCKFAAARQWLERLGFRYEADLPRYAGTTENYARYCLWAQ